MTGELGSSLALSRALTAPLTFQPVYQTVVWGGRRLRGLRVGVPDGPIGEAWDISDHPRGPGVVTAGPLVGRTLGSLVHEAPEQVVGPGASPEQPFPLLIKLIDAADRLSVQVHPDDALAVALGDGDRGKTECWFAAQDGGELFLGTAPGVTPASFDASRLAGTLDTALRRFHPRAGDFYFLPARTVHAIGAGCLLWEVQQTSDITYRVDDWGRVGLDGNPRPLHVTKSLQTIDFGAEPYSVASSDASARLITCPYFTVDRLWVDGNTRYTSTMASVIMTLEDAVTVTTVGGSVRVAPFSAALVPAAAGAVVAITSWARAVVLVATVAAS